jgi:hypothetical protein
MKPILLSFFVSFYFYIFLFSSLSLSRQSTLPQKTREFFPQVPYLILIAGCSHLSAVCFVFYWVLGISILISSAT